ncbi:YkuS family protein [Paenibacillus athensensis]|uniref:Uncharacterized protein n=1 Tax=Paenibacillus athensensis TaxID=1967502 RepID=A0A4Y8Q6A9_9BACL|nr:YkuS family protein [Paenibacillus athensensis]MCD1259718.1 YkuS family protein [Paenibacillus athensensis]
MAKVAVEQTLGDVKEALQSSGFEVVSIEQAENVACCVISGQDKNVLGVADAVSKGAVINADGLTATQVVEQVERSVKQSV